MPVFTNLREKRYWLYALLVILAIFLTLLLDRPFGHFMRDEHVQAGFFIIGFIGIIITIFLYGLKKRSSPIEWFVWFGMISVYLLLLFRLNAPERSHLIEYGVLAVFIHLALHERSGQHQNTFRSAFYAFFITSVIGVLDECMQWFLPNRVFDTNDMIFNAFAALMAIVAVSFLLWVKNKFTGRMPNMRK